MTTSSYKYDAATIDTCIAKFDAFHWSKWDCGQRVGGAVGESYVKEIFYDLLRELRQADTNSALPLIRLFNVIIRTIIKNEQKRAV